MDTTVRIRIEGVSPLLLDACTIESITNGEIDSRGGKPGKPRKVFGGKEALPRQQAESRLYRSVADDETLVMPVKNLFKCITQAGRFHKLGKRQVSTRDESLLPGGMNITAAEFPLEHAKPWEVDGNPITTASGGKQPCFRPRFDDWALEFELQIDTTMFPLTLMRSIVDDAGMKIGIGTRRPIRGGWYGKFKVTRWEVVDPDAKSSKKKTPRKKAKGRRRSA